MLKYGQQRVCVCVLGGGQDGQRASGGGGTEVIFFFYLQWSCFCGINVFLLFEQDSQR